MTIMFSCLQKKNDNPGQSSTPLDQGLSSNHYIWSSYQTRYYLNTWIKVWMSSFKPKDTKQALSRKESAVNMEKFKKFAARRKWKVLFFVLTFDYVFCLNVPNSDCKHHVLLWLFDIKCEQCCALSSAFWGISIMCHTNKSRYFHTRC